MTAALAAELEKLSTAEKLLLVEELWNDIAKESNSVESAWHDQVLAKDAADYDREVIASRLDDYRVGKSVPVPHAQLMRKLWDKTQKNLS